MAINDGHGTTITFGTSGFSMNLITVGGPSLERASIPTTHMGTTTAHSSIPASLYDTGSVDITFQFDPATTVPIDQAAETITINWAGSGDTWSFSGYMTNFSPGASSGELMEASCTLKATGSLTQ